MTRTTWIQTLGSNGKGGKFDPTDPKPEDVDFAVIARVLARTPRFGGHTNQGVYSVAQHCVEGARSLLREVNVLDRLQGQERGAQQRWAAATAFLLHDAHEAYIGDIATPVAESLAFLANGVYPHVDGAYIVKFAIHALKGRLDEAIYGAAGVAWPLAPEVASLVKQIDVRMCRTERDARMATPPGEWDEAIEAAEPVPGVDLSMWSEDEAAGAWLDMARELLPSLRTESEWPGMYVDVGEFGSDPDKTAREVVEGADVPTEIDNWYFRSGSGS